jgi:hypothetical protein
VLPHVASQLVRQAVLSALAQTRYIHHLQLHYDEHVAMEHNGFRVLCLGLGVSMKQGDAYSVHQHDIADSIA